MGRVKVLVVCAFLMLASSVFATANNSYYTDINEPVAASSFEGQKQASGSNYSILSMIGFGDANVKSIADKAGITKVSHVDKKTFTVWMLFAEEKFTVYGD